MDMLDNGAFPPNVTLSPANNNYLPPTTAVTNPNSMMMYSSQPQTHIQHHQTSNVLYRQSQSQPQPMYNSYVQPSPNQVAPGYYPMPPPSQQQRMSPAHHHPSQLTKRQTLMQQQQQQQRPSTPMNQQQQQQLQLHMSMNVTLPHVNELLFLFIEFYFSYHF